MGPIIVGISGVSCGGKSLLCEKIAQRYPAVVFNMDDYYFWPDVNNRLHYPAEYNHTYANFEVASAVNFEQLHQDLDEKVKEVQQSTSSNSYPIILVEGILIFDFQPLQKHLRKRYFLTVTKDVAAERRSHRVYEPPDPVGYFDKYVWPYYMKHRESLADQTDIVYLDGSIDVGVNLKKICKELDSIIAARKNSI